MLGSRKGDLGEGVNVMWRSVDDGGWSWSEKGKEKWAVGGTKGKKNG
jgi:hypothetical protein